MAKSMRKFMPAVIILLIAAAMVGTSTYAWFSMNNKVNVTGMTVTATVDQNLLIAADALDSTARIADEDFGNTLVQSVSGTLKPVSTTNGKTFYYTGGQNVKGNGDAMNDEYTAYDRDNAASATAFNTNYKTTGAVGYVDYVFQLKAVNLSTDAEIRLTKLDLTYGGESMKVTVGNQEIDTKAFRVAVFYEDVTAGTSVGTLNNAAVKTLALFKPEGAKNYDDNQAVNGVTTLGAVTYCSQDTTAKIFIAAGETKYYKVVARLWLEGEDKTCRNDAFARLNDKWALDLEFNQLSVLEPANSVVYLNQKTTAAADKTDISTKTVTLEAGKVVINDVTYYPISGKTLYGDQLYAMVAPTAHITPDSRVFVIPDEDQLYVREVTNQVTITPPTVDSAVEHATIKVTLTSGKLSLDDQTPDTYEWKNAKDGTTVVDTADGTAEFSPEEAGEYYCLITSTDGIVYKTASYSFENAVCAVATGNVSTVFNDGTYTYAWYDASDDSAVAGGTGRVLTAPAAGTYYCEMTKGADTLTTIKVSVIDADVDAGDAAKAAVVLSGSGNLSNGKTPVGYAWKKANGQAAGGTDNEQSFTAATTGDYYCLITADDGKVYRTENVHLTTTP